MNNNESQADENSPARVIGEQIRTARRRRGMTIAELADKLGRQREWLNRIELGYSDQGEYKPATQTDLQSIVECLGNVFEIPLDELFRLGKQAEEEFDAARHNIRRSRRSNFGKLTQTEVIIGEKQIVQAILDLINDQHSDAIIRNTGIKREGSYLHVSEEWKHYRIALGKFLEQNPNAVFKRVEYAASSAHLEKAKEADEKLKGDRDVKQVHNARVKFHRSNPLQLHVVIGQREAILALAQTSGQAGSNIALLVRDKIFVEALRVWYDEVLWDAPGDSKYVDFSKFDESFDVIKKMYGYKD